MQTIYFLARAVPGLVNIGMTVDVMLLHEIDVDCAKSYKSVQRHPAKTNTNSDDSMVIDLLVLKINTIPKSTQLSDWLHRVESNLDEAN